MKLSPKRTLILLAALTILPVAASYLTFYVIKPQQRVNYGDLITPPQPLPEIKLTALDGSPFSLSQLKGKWIMLHINASACDENCRTLLYYMRQSRTAQGKEMERITRVWLLTDGGTPAPELLREYPGLHIARAGNAAALNFFPATTGRAAHIYLIDPYGNLMLRFSPNPDAARIIKDLQRLLKVSREPKAA